MSRLLYSIEKLRASLLVTRVEMIDFDKLERRVETGQSVIR